MKPGKTKKVLVAKKRLKSKDFLKFYDAIWQGTAPIKYKNPDNALRERIIMIKMQCGGPPFS